MNLKNQLRLPDELKSKRLIGLGEIAHGSSGLHAIACELALDAVRNFETDLIMIEAPSGPLEIINQSLASGDDIPMASFKDLYSVWQSSEMLEFFRQIAKINATRSSPISVIGIDVRIPFAEVARISAFAQTEGRDFRKIFPIENISAKDFYRFESDVLQGKIEIQHDIFKSINNELNELLRILETGGVSDKKLQLRLTNDVHIIRSWNDFNFYTAKEDGHDVSFCLRDKGMFENIMRTIPSNSKSPAIIIAHLCHLIYKNTLLADQFSYFAKGALLGERLRDDLGDEYVTLALTAHSLELSNGDGKTATFDIADDAHFPKKSADAGVQFFGPKRLIAFGELELGKTNSMNHVLRESYANIKVSKNVQFDYLVICEHASGLTKPANITRKLGSDF